MTQSSAAPKISIVTPSFNQAAYLEEALWSVKNQNYPHVEHIVVDGASTDGSVEILRRHASLPGWEHLRWLSEPDRGQSDALNKGFRMATGDVIGWLNSDDRYRKGCFHTVVAAFSKCPQADVLYGDYTWIDKVGKLQQVRREIDFSSFVLRYHRVLYVPTTATFFRKRIFDDGNFIDLQYHYSMDYEFFLRLAGKGYRFDHIRELLADFRWHSESKSTAQAKKQLIERDQILPIYSPLIGRLSGGPIRSTLVFVLRATAQLLRSTQKLLIGSYRDQFWPTVSSEASSVARNK